MNAKLPHDALHFSVSQMKTWLQCPKKFEMRYVRGVQPDFVPMPLAFGTAYHSALAYHYGWHMRGEPAPVEEVKARFVDAFKLAQHGPVPLQVDEDDGDGFATMQAKGLQMLDVTLAHPSSQPAKVLGVEVPFTVDLFNAGTGELLEEKLVGVIDLVVQEEGRRVLVEHKTSSKKYTLDQLTFDTQLSGYAFAAHALGYGEVGLRYSITTKTKVPQLQVEDVMRDDGQQKDFLDTALGVLTAVDAGISFPIRGWQCKSCPFRSRCESER